ncbi:ABC transporter substrate-binding protein [Frondihabitans sp. PAMC 28766]|nr:ABC transporter substrate-binding protein [Frondihabitans sp. PAMC 28766]
MASKKRAAAVAGLGLAAVLALSACSSGGNAAAGSGSAQKVPTTSGKGKTLTVWVMTGDYTPKTIAAINKEFTAKTGAKVNVQTQQWTNITTKISTALATSTPPDVLDLGNTQVASYAANGALKDLTSYKKDLEQGQTWLGGLEQPATISNKLYAVPGFAGARAVIYNKPMWAKAGITTAPTTYSELTADLDKVKAQNTASDFSPFYLPGQYWYAGMQFVWDAGGDIATPSGKKWTAGFTSAKAQKGLSDFKTFQNTYSTKASQTLDTDTPAQETLFADGKTSAILDNNWALGLIQKANPKLTNADLGSFPFPGKSGSTQPAMLGGSDWGIAQKSKNSDLALEWTKLATSPSIQSKWVYGNDGWIPNSTEGIKAADATVDPFQKGFFDAALNSKATPASGNWAALEGNSDINQLFEAVASGSKTPEAAAQTFDSAANTQLNTTN